MPAELFDGHQILDGRDPQLRDQFARREQGTQRDQHGADPGKRDAVCTHRTPLGMISPTRVPLVTPAFEERGRHRAGRRVEFAVGDAVDPGR